MNNRVRVAYSPGDGIGVEIMDSVLKIFKHARVPLDFVKVDMGKEFYLKGFSSGMTSEAQKIIEECGILFKGPMETPKGKGVKSINVTCRKMWNTFANCREFKIYPGVRTIFSQANIPINLIIVRENIEDTYGAIEHMQTHDVAQCRRLITRPGCLQVHKHAFDMAKQRGIKKVTCGHKANIMKLTDGMFLETFYQVAQDYPEIEAEDLIIDNLCMKLVTIPNKFEMIVLPNLQGDIVSDLCAGLIGGLGMAPSANIGNNICVFEAVHGTAPDIAGKDVANPCALLLSGCMMLRHVGLENYANHIEETMMRVLTCGIKTKDLCKEFEPWVTRTKFTQELYKYLQPFMKTPTFTPPTKQNDFIMHTTYESKKKTVGMDIFIDSNLLPNRIAEILNKTIPEEYKLQMISNRGTQVWPSGSFFTECINHHRCRIIVEEPEHNLYQVVADISRELRVCSVEMLLEIDGKSGFSLAQGQ